MNDYKVTLFTENTTPIQADSVRDAYHKAKDALPDDVRLTRATVTSAETMDSSGLVVNVTLDGSGLHSELRSAPIKTTKDADRFVVHFLRNGRQVGSLEIKGDAASLSVLLPQIPALWNNGNITYR